MSTVFWLTRNFTRRTGTLDHDSYMFLFKLTFYENIHSIKIDKSRKKHVVHWSYVNSIGVNEETVSVSTCVPDRDNG